jgi:GrpB-like predicted nucleotidyltransferase (UPF0157 family)
MAQDRSDKAKAYIRDWKRRNPEKMAEYRRKEKIRTAFTDKIAAFAAYGGPKCVCCGEEGVSFLTLDHVNDDGYNHRKVVGSGSAFYRWLKRNHYPQDPPLQVLCANCNQSKQVNGGVCEHKLERRNASEIVSLWEDGRRKKANISKQPQITGGIR